jgi:beta-cyano-L-alanine hydratase/nitrilase
MSTFGCVVGERAISGRDEFVRYYSGAINLPSPELSRVEAVSKETGVFIVAGVIERDGGTLYCTVIFVSPTDGFVAKHRKLMPTAQEVTTFGTTPIP